MAICDRRVDTTVIVGCLLLAATAAQATELPLRAESEREVLGRIVHELRLIETLVERANARQRRGARVSFDYKQLTVELRAVREGIDEYIHGTRLQPRTFAPLQADYTEVRRHAAAGEAE